MTKIEKSCPEKQIREDEINMGMFKTTAVTMTVENDKNDGTTV